jgi:hypothetical protein
MVEMILPSGSIYESINSPCSNDVPDRLVNNYSSQVGRSCSPAIEWQWITFWYCMILNLHWPIQCHMHRSMSLYCPIQYNISSNGLWKCVRGSPLAVIMGLVESQTAHTTPRLASIQPSGVPFSGGSYQSREESTIGQWQLRPGPWETSFISGNYAGHACEQARQLIVNCK